MQLLPICTFMLVIRGLSAGVEIYESDVNFRVDPGSKTCFFEKGKAGQVMEAQYQVIDGQHGDLDITFVIVDPNKNVIMSDYKRSENSIIMDLEVDGDYMFCLDNTFSMLNSKLVFVSVLIEDKVEETEDVNVSVLEHGQETPEEEVIEWMGTDDAGEQYYIEITEITDTLTRILKHVIKSRHLLDVYGATRSRDSYLAFQDTFIVDAWSAFQISFMVFVGMVQVYMIKKLFSRSSRGIEGFF